MVTASSNAFCAAAFAAALTWGAGAFAQSDPPRAPPIPDPLVTTSHVAWIAIEKSNDPAAFESFLEKFPLSPEAELAKRKLEVLKRRRKPEAR